MLLTPLLLVAALHAQPTAVLVQAQTSSDTAEGLEILRRILVDSLEKTFQPEQQEQRVTMNGETYSRGLVTLLWAGGHTVEHSRVFHLPDVGLFFALDASLPMVAKKSEPKPDATGDAPRDDEWEKYRREVRGGGETGLPPGTYRLNLRSEGAEMEIDPGAVDKLLDTALQTLARHATRIEGLGAQETLTLAVRITGNHGAGRFWGTSLLEELEGQTESDAEGHLATGTVALPRISTIVTDGEAQTQNLVLQIRIGDLASYTSGGTVELRKRARINRY
jgi:hypothetical protein